jgi:DNA-binding transcriptional ArsR family regulator
MTAASALAAPAPAGLDMEEMLEHAREAAEFLKALSHEARLVILCLLLDGEKSVTELERMLDLRQPAVSQQLARLRADNLVETRRDGKNVYYALARPEVREIVGVLQRAFCPPPA